MIPGLAGLASSPAAARVGPGVDETVARLLRSHWLERRIMALLVARLPATPEWEVKCAFALHQWHAAQRADALRRRVTEMRHPAPSLDASRDEALDAFASELSGANDTAELIGGVYGVALSAVAEAYRAHVRQANPLADQPTLHLMKHALLDLEEDVAWGMRALDSLGAAPEWSAHLKEMLAAAGGVLGDTANAGTGAPHPRRAARAREAAAPEPRRDGRFTGLYNFEFPPHDVYNDPAVPADERNLALLCKRTLEMDVPETIASFMTERDDQPWEFYLDYSRQLWDEARHAMLGTVALQARGVDWTTLPLNVGFSLRLSVHADPRERQIMLYGIEQSLMPADVGKRYEYETARQAGDELSAHFHDFDWADEVLHAHIGRRALKREGISVAQALALAQEIHERTWKALDAYRGRDAQDGSWWDRLVRAVLGRPSAWKPKATREPPKVLTE